MYGKFCVQFIPFKRTSAALEVLSWWQERCLEWCFWRVEDGRFGDQKYLDQWPELFPNAVHVLRNAQLTLGPWNALRYKNKLDFQNTACMYHFSTLKIFKEGVVCLTVGEIRYLPDNILQMFYRPYLNELGQSITHASSVGV